MEEFFSPHEVADRLSLDRKTIYRAIDRKELRAVKIGTALRIPESEVEDWLDRCSL